jgi:hypothetical protein
MSRPPSAEDPTLPSHPDPLDRLLLRVPRAEPDAWFTARTLARCRNSSRTGAFSFWKSFRPRWALGGALALFAGGLALQGLHQSVRTPSSQQIHAQEAFEVLASFDDSDSAATTPDSAF